MQQWNNEIRLQLNDLPGFPPTPTGSPAGTPATDLEWILGDWIQECRLRPSAATFAALPLIGNGIGDVRLSIADQLWYIWDGAAWQPMGGGGGAVNSVGATLPLVSSGGVNPVISITTAGASAGDVLTYDGVSWAAAAPVAAAGTVDIPTTAQEALNAGDLVRFVNDGGTPRVQKADATNGDNRLNPVGFAVAAAAGIGAAVTARIAGVADVPASLFDAAPVPGDVGKRVFMSTTNYGKVTLTAPIASGEIVQRVGVLVDGGANPKVLVQVGDPVLL